MLVAILIKKTPKIPTKSLSASENNTIKGVNKLIINRKNTTNTTNKTNKMDIIRNLLFLNLAIETVLSPL
jgi:hypothetical protein